MNPSRTHKRLALLLLGLGTALGAILLAVDAPLWAFFVVPVFTVPVVIAALNVDPPQGSGRPGGPQRRRTKRDTTAAITTGSRPAHREPANV